MLSLLIKKIRGEQLSNNFRTENSLKKSEIKYFSLKKILNLDLKIHNIT